MDTEQPVPRSAARLVLLDPYGRILLIHFVDDQRGAAWWATPGGGLLEGEDHVDAARRELIEETGLADVEIGPWIWTRRDLYSSRGVLYSQDERFFLVRAPSLAVDDSRLQDEERSLIRGFRWWSVPELKATSEELSPSNLGSLLEDLFVNGLPSVPIAVGR